MHILLGFNNKTTKTAARERESKREKEGRRKVQRE
jgi:hypothetical protein